MWCVPELNEEYIERMEDILSLYAKPHDPKEPVVCLDEKSAQCLADSRKTIRVRNGSVRRDYEYVRKGTANLFCAVEPLAGRHFIKVTQRRKGQDFACMLRDLAKRYPKVKTIHLVVDNLSTHFKKSLVDTFGKRDGNRLWARFTVHYTPKHASWLNMAEVEVGLVSSQCLGKRRISSIKELTVEIAAWRRRVNRKRLKIRWGFSVAKARDKFGYSVSRGRINLSRN
jgi:transposase